MPSAIWGLSQTDLEQRTSTQRVIDCTDDSNAGTADPHIVSAVLQAGEQELLSYLIIPYGPPPLSSATLADIGADSFLRSVALDWAVQVMHERHPEAVPADKGGGLEKRRKSLEAKSERISDSRQRATSAQTTPNNVGGVVYDGANRIYIDSPGGPPGGNAGDY